MKATKLFDTVHKMLEKAKCPKPRYKLGQAQDSVLTTQDY